MKVTVDSVVLLEKAAPEAVPWLFYLMPFSFPIEIVINCTQSVFSIPGIMNAPLTFIPFSFCLDPARYSFPTFDNPCCPFSMVVFLNTSQQMLCSGMVSLYVGRVFKV